jgi:hypothetical protein
VVFVKLPRRWVNLAEVELVTDLRNADEQALVVRMKSGEAVHFDGEEADTIAAALDAHAGAAALSVDAIAVIAAAGREPVPD